MDCYRLRNSSGVFSDLLVVRVVTGVSSANKPCCVVTTPVAMLQVAVPPGRLSATFVHWGPTIKTRSQKRALVAAPFEHKPTDSQTHSPLPNCEETNCNGLWIDASYVLCALSMWTPYSAKTCLATVGGVLEAFSLSSFSRALANTFVFGQSAQRVVVTSWHAGLRVVGVALEGS